ncbi:unnamed protein product [Chrysoparadoxa australica]
MKAAKPEERGNGMEKRKHGGGGGGGTFEVDRVRKGEEKAIANQVVSPVQSVHSSTCGEISASARGRVHVEDQGEENKQKENGGVNNEQVECASQSKEQQMREVEKSLAHVEGQGEESMQKENGGVSNEQLECASKGKEQQVKEAEQSLLMPPPAPDLPRALKRRRCENVVLMFSQHYMVTCQLLAANKQRDLLLYHLLNACGLMQRIKVVAPMKATERHLLVYHAKAYLEALKSPPDPEDLAALEEFNLLDDCSVFKGLWGYCCSVAGASLHAASFLVRGACDTAINWGGGRHHARKDKAGGYCFVNDINLAILHLLKRFRRVLYIDLDVHHSDGVEEAFFVSDRVLHISIHHHAQGFFPGSGHFKATGSGRGANHNLNISLAEGCSDATWLKVFMHTFQAAMGHFRPQAICLQCGADGLSDDNLGPWNLTTRGYEQAVTKVAEQKLPLLVLGGGGYCRTATARLWTVLTSALSGLSSDMCTQSVPEHEYFPLYAPDFSLHTRAKSMEDKNSPDVIARVLRFVEVTLGKMKPPVA